MIYPRTKSRTGSDQNLPERPVFHPLLPYVVLPVSLFFVVAVWSPPLCYSSLVEWFGSWQKRLFSLVCHQQLDRMFHINGIPMAVCSRCTGIYTGLFAAVAIFSLFYTVLIKTKLYITQTFAIVSLIVILDGAANLFQIWHTPDAIRLLVGASWGVLTGVLLVDSLNIH